MKRQALYTLLAVLSLTAAHAQSNPSPPFQYGTIPTAGQWNSYFAAKQDYLGYIPFSSSGGTLTGELWTVGSTMAQSGLNIGVGIAPASPYNGDVWMTNFGLFYETSGITYGPIGGPSTTFFTPLGNTASSDSQRWNRTVSLVDDFGAACNVKYITNSSYVTHTVTATASSTTVDITNAAFVAGDAGKHIVVNGIGTGGLPLASTIATVNSATEIVISNAAITSVTALAAEIAYGSDDTANLNNALAALPNGGQIYLPRGGCGITTTVTLPAITVGFGGVVSSSITISGEGMGVSFLVALAPVSDAILLEPTTYHQNAQIENLTLDAMGVATYALDGTGGIDARVNNVIIKNGLTADTRWGDNVHTEEGASFVKVNMFNDQQIFTTTWPLYNLLVYGSDNQFTNVTLYGSSQAGMRDLSYSNNFYTSLHVYEATLNNYQTAGNAMFVGCEVDTAFSGVGLEIDSGANIWTGGKMFWSSPTTSAKAFYINTVSSGNIVTDPVILGLPNNQLVVSASNQVVSGIYRIPNALTAIATQDVPLVAQTSDATTPVILTTDDNVVGTGQTAFNSIYLGGFGLTSIRGTLVAFDGFSGYGESWDVVAFFQGGATAATLIGTATVTPLVTSPGFSLATAPTITASASGVVSFAITVKGIAGHNIGWKFIPLISAAQ